MNETNSIQTVLHLLKYLMFLYFSIGILLSTIKALIFLNKSDSLVDVLGLDKDIEKEITLLKKAFPEASDMMLKDTAYERCLKKTAVTICFFVIGFITTIVAFKII